MNVYGWQPTEVRHYWLPLFSVDLTKGKVFEGCPLKSPMARSLIRVTVAPTDSWVLFLRRDFLSSLFPNWWLHQNQDKFMSFPVSLSKYTDSSCRCEFYTQFSGILCVSWTNNENTWHTITQGVTAGCRRAWTNQSVWVQSSY